MPGLSHRRRFLSFVTAVLYGALCAGTSASRAAESPATETVPHIAVLLPLGSGPFVSHAEAVRNGFLAAAEVQGTSVLPLRIYAASDDANVILSGYRQAIAAGARLVVGPLTRTAVSAVAATNLIPVPTLVLNVPDGVAIPPERLFMLSLQVESEAKLVARLAYDEGARRVYSVAGTDALSKRMHDAFIEEFKRLGGAHADEQIYGGDRASLERYRAGIAASNADAVFLALDAERGRAVRPYLGALPVYATSQIFPGTDAQLAAFELADVRFVGMPWLLQPDHAAVMVYPRPAYGGDLDLQRLYALGIDAFRIGQELAAGHTRFTLDGVTGQLVLGADHQFRRALPVAQFVDGGVTVVGQIGP